MRKADIRTTRTCGVRSKGAAGLAARAGTAPAFTLLEMLVAVGAVALIAIGLARIFGATSDTLRAGRRISAFNDYAAMIERTMRQDFSAMSRDGVLVIVNEKAYDPSDNTRRRGPRLDRNDQSINRPVRRIDQVMFYAEGKFISARTPLDIARIASGNEARIWYGHGLRQFDDRQPPANPPDLKLDDHDDPHDGSPRITLPYFGQPGPNQYASDWSLLRQVCVLAQPQSSVPPRPAGSLWSAEQWEDSQIQIDLQPSQASPFWFIALGEPVRSSLQQLPIRGSGVALGQEYHPLTASGLVDVITGNLTDIRSIILDAQLPAVQSLPPQPIVFDFNADGSTYPITGFEPNLTVSPTSSTTVMKRWMRYLLPAPPYEATSAAYRAHGGRVRYQANAPDAIGTLVNGGYTYSPDQEYRRTDQAMLSSSVFVPACTEFIVEWSFGKTRPANAGNARAGELIWHGMSRFADLNFDGVINDANDNSPDALVLPYKNNAQPRQVPTGYPNDPPLVSAAQPSDAFETGYLLSNGVESPVPWRLKPEVIQDVLRDGTIYTTFGYYDATFAPGQAPFTAGGQPENIPVPWPKLVRVTMSFVDPAEPTVEQTYQFVFEVPSPRSKVAAVN